MSKPSVTRPTLFMAIGLVCLVSGSAAAQYMQHAPVPAGAEPATQAYLAASERMHQDMAIELTGDPEVDFARAMIPHHQGAIDMAQVLLEYGTDPALRTLAEDIIEAQESEIAFLRAWLEQHGQKAD